MNKNLLFLILFCSALTFGQTNKLYHKSFTSQNGLNIDDINTLCFDDDGFLWIGGSNLDNREIINSNEPLTLQRFNGINFHDFSLPNIGFEIIDVEQIYKRKDGLFYIKTKVSNGNILFLFNPYNTTFKPIKFYNRLNINALSKVISYQSKDYILSQKNREISLNEINQDLSIETIFSFTCSENKYLLDSSSVLIPFDEFWLISDDNFPPKIINWKGEILKQFSSNSFKNDLKITKEKEWVDEYFFKNDSLYAFTFNNPNLQLFDKALLTFKPLNDDGFTLKNQHLQCLSDANQHLIISSNKEQLSFSTLDKKRINITYQTNLENIGSIKTASKNLNNEIWLATNGQLHYYRFPEKSVENYLISEELRALTKIDSTNFLIATESGGWFQLNKKKDSVFPYIITDNNKSFKPSSSRNLIIENETIWSNSGGNIIEVNKQSKTVKKHRHYPITSLVKPNDSIIVYGTKGYNLMQFNTVTKTHKPLLKTDTLDIYDLAQNKHLIVAATNKGVLTYDLDTRRSQLYSNLNDNFILMVDYINDYGFVLGTQKGYLINYKAEINLHNVIYKDKLNAGIATIIYENQQFWINTFNGYVLFDPENKSVTRFSEKDGFSHYEANRYSALKTKNGYFIGSLKGLNFFNPSNLKPNVEEANLTLLKINQFDKTKKSFTNFLNRSYLDSLKNITIPTENRALTIDFGLKNCNSVNKDYSFRYRLNDNDWINLNNSNSIQFPNLASGTYKLVIEANNFSGVTIGKPLTINIISKAFFYKTWWFIGSIFLGVILFLLWLLKQAKKRKELQVEFSQKLIQSQEHERLRIAKELHDSVGQQLTLIKKKAQTVNQDEISLLTNSTLEEVRAISRGLFPPLLKQLGLKESIEQLALDVDEQTEIFVSVEVDDIDHYFKEDETLNCYRFIQECINNILKHANAKALSIKVLKQKNAIIITIKDNGKGFNTTEAKNRNSLGLKTINERIRILNGDLNIESHINKGTTITATIPIKNE